MMEVKLVTQQKSVHGRLKKYAQLSPQQTAEAFHASPQGYSQEQVSESRQRYGSNSSVSQAPDSLLYYIRRSFINPFSTILFFLWLIALVTDVLLPNGYRKNITSVLLIFSMLIISGTVRLIQELHSKRVADRLSHLVHTTVQVLRNGEWTELLSSHLVVGDQVRLEAGDRVPADLRLLSASDLFLSQSVITGESAAIEKTPEPLLSAPSSLNDYRNILFCGTTVTGGSGTGIVLAVGRDTVYGGFSTSDTKQNSGFDRGANSIAWVLIRFTAVLVPVVLIASGLTKGDWVEAFAFALSVAVGLTPELLPMVVNACLVKGSFSMGQKQTVVKNINAMQGFGSMDILCVDKTGTLTGNSLLLEYYMDILGNESQYVLDCAYLASCYHTGVENPLDAAIRKTKDMPGKQGYYEELLRQHPKLDEFPFDYERGFASVLLKDEEENLLIVKGSIDSVVSRCSMVEYQGISHAIDRDGLRHAHAITDEMLEDGMKVIAIACRPMNGSLLTPEDERDLTLLGYLVFFDAPKKSASSAIQKLQNLHVPIKVMTGDQKQVALSICRRLGLPSSSCLTGPELESLSENELPIAVERTHIFAELSPRQKAMLVQTLQANGHTVGFLGDGMNDLPAVIQADVGISVDNGTEAVKECADVILMEKDLNVLEEGILEGRKTFANMTKYIKITASSNFGNICAIVIASILLPFFPMTSVQLLLLNLLYDTLCLILPWDHVDDCLLSRSLEWSGKGLQKFMTFFGPVSSLFDLVTFAFLYFILCPAVCGGNFSSLSSHGQAYFISLFQTGWFLESMWTQVLILQLLRTPHLPFLQSCPPKIVLAVTGLGILLFTLLPTTPLGTLLGLTPLPPAYFLFLIADVAVYLMLVTLAKSVYIRKHHKLI